ncbi:hypothetical protein [Enterococcus sp. UD-01]|jgi:hypothetical protein|uniref:hypothetical protein n=1 Tax=Enterococcus sp. UD-01 TaxID=3373911 RepID=UPI0038327C32
MPKHDFKVVPYKADLSFEEIKFTETVTVDDDIILYTIDTLNWIKAAWNSIDNLQVGLNYYGGTFFYSDSLVTFKSILTGWVSIFEHATEEFKLANSMEPEKLFKKQIVLEEFNSVIHLCDEALKEEKVLVHYGI